jgi:hypothetical protein
MRSPRGRDLVADDGADDSLVIEGTSEDFLLPFLTAADFTSKSPRLATMYANA